jgi:hypothetical protein
VVGEDRSHAQGEVRERERGEEGMRGKRGRVGRGERKEREMGGGGLCSLSLIRSFLRSSLCCITINPHFLSSINESHLHSF